MSTESKHTRDEVSAAELRRAMSLDQRDLLLKLEIMRQMWSHNAKAEELIGDMIDALEALFKEQAEARS